MVTPYQWRLDKGQRFLEAARAASAQGHWETAVSRAYYAVYHAAIALLEAKAAVKRKRWEHRTVLWEFQERFSKKGYLFGKNKAEDFTYLQQERFRADYDDETFNERRARRALSQAEALHGKILEVIHGP